MTKDSISHSNESQPPLEDVKHREVFADGSELVELMNGCLLILEGNSKSVPIFSEHTAACDRSAPTPDGIQEALRKIRLVSYSKRFHKSRVNPSTLAALREAPMPELLSSELRVLAADKLLENHA